MSKFREAQFSMNIFDQIEQICSEFRVEWKRGKRPKLEKYLNRVPESAQHQLFRNLLNLELRYRNRLGESPRPDEYLGRFPGFERAIGDSFQYSTSMDLEVHRATSPDLAEVQTRTYEGPAANRLGDYQLIREIGHGAFGRVYEAIHDHNGNRVALKTLPTGIEGQDLNAERLYSFRREFRTLSNVNHPNLIGMQTLEVDEGQWYLTMDLVDGVDFFRFVRPGNVLDESRLRKSLRQLAQGIVALHDRGIVHRDLKPSNVLVRSDGHVSILDFGLVLELETVADKTVSLQESHFAGTPRYASPEQFRGQRNFESDWYAFGTMIFEALTGQAPFKGNVYELSEVKNRQAAPQLDELAGSTADLARLTNRLLERQQDLRPNRQDIGEILGLEQLDSINKEWLRLIDQPEVQLVGREEQLEQLSEIKEQFLKTRAPTVVWITGKSGEGKSALAETFLRPLRSSDEVLVLSGRCYDRESVPFKVIDAILNSLVRYLQSANPSDVASWVPDEIEYLADIFPILRRVKSIPWRPQLRKAELPPEQIRHRAFQAFEDLLTGVAERVPIVIAIDDLQWGDADSAEILVQLLKSDTAKPLFFFGNYRIDEAPKSLFLNHWKTLWPEGENTLTVGEIQVSPLTPEQCMRIVESRLGCPPQTAQSIGIDLFKKSEGNPYILEQLVERFDHATETITARSLETMIDDCMNRLPSDARALLEVISVVGQPMDVKEVLKLHGEDKQMLGTLMRMSNEKLLRIVGGGTDSLLDTYHDKIRETVLDSLPAESKKKTHLKVAEFLEKQENLSADEILSTLESHSIVDQSRLINSDRIFDLAHHFYEAEDERAFAYQVASGQEANKAYAPQAALEHLQRAIQIRPANSSSASKTLLWTQTGLAQQRLRMPSMAIVSYNNALESAMHDFEKAEALVGQGICYEMTCNYQDAVACYNAALASLGRRRSKYLTMRIFRAIVLLTTLHISPPSWLKARDLQEQRREELIYKIFSNLGFCIQDTETPLDFIPCHIETIRCLLRLGGPDREFAAQECSRVIFSGGLGLPTTSKDSTEKYRTLHSDNVDPNTKASSLLWNSLSHIYGGKLKNALSNLKSTLNISEDSGNYVWAVLAKYFICYCHRFSSSTAVELESAKDLLEKVALPNDARSNCYGNYCLAAAHARRGQLREAHEYQHRAISLIEGKNLTCLEVVCRGVAGYVSLQASDLPQAREHLRTSWGIASARRAYFEFTIATLPLLMQSLVGFDWLNPAPKELRREIQSIFWQSRLFYRLTWMKPQIVRSQGRYRISQGRTEQGIRSLKKATLLAKKLDLKVELARALLDLAAVSSEQCDENRAEAIQLLKEMESVIPRAEAWLLGDQYDEAVVAPEFDLATWQRKHPAHNTLGHPKQVTAAPSPMSTTQHWHS